MFEQVKNIPCYAEFYKYIQWHNLALQATSSLHIPTMTIHYENYTNNFDQTKNLLLGFLEQEGISEPLPFVSGKTYREYFGASEARAVSKMLKKLAHNRTWELVKHYFNE